MKIYTESFLGHRDADNIPDIEDKLEQIVSELIKTKEYVEFLVGRSGEFDLTAAAVIRRVKRSLDYGNASLTLVLPYMTAEYRDNEDSFHNYYDDIEICSESAKSHFKAAIQIRNISYKLADL
ncbi:MAG: hypothetical protein ACI4TH_01260 [Candidatus Ornithomonoglobus sp.]